MANVGAVGLDWQERVNWDRLRKYRLERARERMKAHGLGAMLLMYDENVRYVTSTLTPGWNRLKPGLRYALLCGDDAPVLIVELNPKCLRRAGSSGDELLAVLRGYGYSCYVIESYGTDETYYNVLGAKDSHFVKHAALGRFRSTPPIESVHRLVASAIAGAIAAHV